MKQAVALLAPASVWRLRLAAVLFAAATLLMVGRLFDLHVFDRDFYQRHGDARAIRTETIEAHRGMIVDRNGHPLAVSTPLESICANPKTVLAAAERIPELARVLEINPRELRDKLQAGAAANREFLYLRRQLPPDVASSILELKVPGIYSRTEYRRYYPDGEVTAHVLGFTNVDDHGQEGVELAFDGHLRGQDGKRKVLQDRRAEPIRELSRIKDPRPGGELRLSLDARIQALAYRELKAAVQENGASGGSVVMLDSTTGDVLAMVNQPSFNPNNRVGLQPHNLRNRAIIDLVEPGSTVKPFTLAVALASGRYQPSTIIDTTPGYIQVNGKVIRDVHNYGVIDLSHVLSKSSNVGTIKVALTLGETAVRDMFDQVGLGRSTGSGFPGEAVGSLPSGPMRHPLVRATLSFGYGLAVTPLQLAEAYSVLANGGVRRGVKILADSAVDPGVRVIDPHINRQIVTMLEQVVTQEGTGFKARVPGYRVAGKTGTVHKIGTGGYEASSYLSVFAGFAPVEQPRVVAVIIIDNPTAGAYYGGAVAAPVFGKVMTGTLRLLDVPPDDVPATGKGLQVAKGGPP